MLQFHWQAGDPTPLGWTTTVAYFVAALACASAWLRFRAVSRDFAAERRVWLGFGLLLLFFGANKQADLQTLLVQWGREAAHRVGVFEYRRYLQAGFFALILTATLTIAWRLRESLGSFGRTNAAAVIGLCAILIYGGIRFAAISHVEPAALISPEDPVRYGFLEILGCVLVLYAAIKALCTVPERQS